MWNKKKIVVLSHKVMSLALSQDTSYILRKVAQNFLEGRQKNCI